MAPYLIFAVGPDGHFVYFREMILAPSHADALERARQMHGVRAKARLAGR
jgi:hypothetical protein